MEHPDHYFLGKILRTHGVMGDLIIYLDTDTPKRYKSIKLIYVDVDGQLKEFDVTKISVKEKEHLATIHLRGIEDMTTAENYLKSSLYLPLSSLPKLRGKKFYYHEIVGYAVDDIKFGNVGVIKEVLELPQHPVAECVQNEKNILIPLSENFIVKIDRNAQIITTDLPDGLIDVYE
jgi:16S rRNA processing protein RimM